MTRQTFYRRLRKVAPNFVWAIEDDVIKGTHKEFSDEQDFCPITALVYTITKEYYFAPSYKRAAQNHLNMKETDAKAIAFNADTKSYNPQVRNALLRAVGLS